MKVTIKYDQGVKKEEIVTLEVSEKELEKMVELDYQQRLASTSSGEMVLKRTPEEIIEEWNRQEYNDWRRHHRYLERYATIFEKEEQSEIADNIQEKERKKQEDYDDICQKIRQILKSEQADMIIAIYIDGMSVKGYARKINDRPNNVTQRLKRVKRVLNTILSESKEHSKYK